MKKFKLCPYCNGTPKLKKASVKFIENNIDKYYVECADCGAATIQYDTFFGYSISGGKFHTLSQKEAIGLATTDWNEKKFNSNTKLKHMSYKDKVIWQIRNLLMDAWYGTMVPVDSPEWQTGWALRKIAENRKLLVLHSNINYDLDEVARVLFNDIEVKDIIFGYLEARTSKSEIDGWTNISPSPVRSHSSFALNSRQIAEIVWSEVLRPPSISATEFDFKFIRSPNSR